MAQLRWRAVVTAFAIHHKRAGPFVRGAIGLHPGTCAPSREGVRDALAAPTLSECSVPALCSNRILSRQDRISQTVLWHTGDLAINKIQRCEHQAPRLVRQTEIGTLRCGSVFRPGLDVTVITPRRHHIPLDCHRYQTKL
jgi:hypothetical protein